MKTHLPLSLLTCTVGLCNPLGILHRQLCWPVLLVLGEGLVGSATKVFVRCPPTLTSTELHTCLCSPVASVCSAGLKAYATAFTQDALSICRESTGGHGYAAINRLGQMRSDHDIFQTFEGDNTVLLQQVGAVCSARICALVFEAIARTFL